MLMLAFFVMAILHFGGFAALPLWLVFSPLILWVVVVVILGGIIATLK